MTTVVTPVEHVFATAEGTCIYTTKFKATMHVDTAIVTSMSAG